MCQATIAGIEPIAITNDEVHTSEEKKPSVIPRELCDNELTGIVAGFKRAAKNTQASGFDRI